MKKQSNFKDKILIDARKHLTEKKKRIIEHFKERYDKPKVYEFPTIDKINMTKHFYFPKGFITLAGLTKAAIAVYPVLCSMADFEKNNWIQLSRENIAKIAGINPITVDRGIANLLKFENGKEPLLERKMETNGKEHYYLYRIGFVRKDMLDEYNGQFFIFHDCIITSGIWAKLSSRAKALYLGIRTIAKFDYESYAFENDLEFSEKMELTGEQNRNREWDYCLSSMAELCRMVRISSSNMNEVLEQLEHYQLVQRDYRYWIVYLKPRIRKNE